MLGGPFVSCRLFTLGDIPCVDAADCPADLASCDDGVCRSPSGTDGGAEGEGEGEVAPSFVMPDSAAASCQDADGDLIACPDEGYDGYGQDGSYVRPAPAFTRVGGVVFDALNGLEWQPGSSAVAVPPEGAAAYCVGVELDGLDWRLPRLHELYSLLDLGRGQTPLLDALAFDGTASDVHWSSTRSGGGGRWLGVDVDTGLALLLDATDVAFVKCVRGPEADLSTPLEVDGAVAVDERRGSGGSERSRRAAAGRTRSPGALA